MIVNEEEIRLEMVRICMKLNEKLEPKRYSFCLGIKAGILKTINNIDFNLWKELVEIESHYIKIRKPKIKNG